MNLLTLRRRLYDPLTDSCEDSRTAHRLLRYWKKAPPLSRRGFFHVPLALPFRRRPCFDLGKARDANSNTGRRAAEAKFPYRIDIPVPVGGLGNRLTEMLMWCRENIPAGAWAQHGHSERPKARNAGGLRSLLLRQRGRR
jgi:hypothetical protein